MEFFLSKLNDREFESLSADIISDELDLTVEKFKAGRDGGVDGRFWIGKREGIIQCKHYWKTGYKGLISKLKKEEVDKVKKLNPIKYVFFTSIPLSRENKKEIVEIFSPFIKSESDVWGEDDINDFLSKKENQNIVEKNYKLWITSTQILDIVYNNAIKGRSESTLSEIKSNNERYVITNNHTKGTEILKNSNVIIISGEPGIGKTTLANNLALYYTANGFEFCDIEESISEAEAILRQKEKKKIVFYCDDFLGSNVYDAISNKRDSHIVKFINRIKKDDSKKFILTSRTNILAMAVSSSHRFQNEDLREDEFLLKIEDLSDLDKAKILYNHIYHSNLDNVYIDEIYKQKRYKQIIQHKNFNPRIIEFITNNKRISRIKSSEYWNYIVDKLDNPKEIWSNFFQYQIDDPVRVLTFLTVFNSGVIGESVLSKSYSFYKQNFKMNTGSTDSSFDAVRKLAIKSLLNRRKIGDRIYEYTLFNPSVSDFVLNAYLEDVDLVESVLKALGTRSSIDFLNSLKQNNRISRSIIREIQSELFRHFCDIKLIDRDWDYLVQLSCLDILNTRVVNSIEKFIIEISSYKEARGERLYELLELLIDFNGNVEIKDFSFVAGYIQYGSLDREDINKVVELIRKYDIKDEILFENLSDEVDSYIREVFADNKSSANLEPYIHSSYDHEHGEFVLDFDSGGIEHEMESILDTIISELDEKLLDYIEIDGADIIESIEIDQLVDDFISSYGEGYEEEFRGGYSSGGNSSCDIEAIFERN